MKLYVDYFDSVISFENGTISVLELENKMYFYCFIHDLILLENGAVVENMRFLENNGMECTRLNLKVVIDYFNFSFDSSKINNYILKQIMSSIKDNEQKIINKEYQKICKCFYGVLENLDIPLSFSDELNIESLIKLLKIRISSRNKLIDNLFLLVDISKTLENNHFLVFVNLKQYLTSEELIELYKYSIYNEVRLLLIDSQSYGIKLDYENKWIIDENMDEFVL